METYLRMVNQMIGEWLRGFGVLEMNLKNKLRTSHLLYESR